MDITDNLTSKAFPEVPNNWSLANDATLSKLLQRLSEKLTLKTHDVQTAMNKLVTNLDDVGVRVCNTNNDLIILSHKQFIENRTYISGNTSKPCYPSSTINVSMTMTNQTGILTSYKSALMSGISICNERDESVNMFTSRPLPPIIGSDEFLLQNNYCPSTEKLKRKEHSNDSIDSDKSIPVLRSVTSASTPISVTVLPGTGDDFSLAQSSHSKTGSLSSNDLLENAIFVQKVPNTTENEPPMIKGVPVLPLLTSEILKSGDESETQNSAAAIKDGLNQICRSMVTKSTKNADLFDSSSDSDELFTPIPRSLSFMKTGSSQGPNEIEDGPAKKIPTGGVSIFPSSVTKTVQNTILKKPPLIKPKPSNVTFSENPPPLKSDLFDTNVLATERCRPKLLDESDSELFVPVDPKVNPPLLKFRKISVHTSSSEEESSDLFFSQTDLPKSTKKSVLPSRRKPLLSSKQKSIWSSDESDSDPFSCALDASTISLPNTEFDNIIKPNDNISTVLSVETLKNSIANNNSNFNDCDIFSDLSNISSKQVSDKFSSETKSKKCDIKLHPENSSYNGSDDEDIFKTALNSSPPRNSYSFNIPSVDSAVPPLPSRSSSVSDEVDDTFSGRMYSPPPMNHIVAPMFGDLSPPLLETTTLNRSSHSFLGDSPPPIIDSKPSFSPHEDVSRGKVTMKSQNDDICDSLSGTGSTTTLEKLDGYDASIESNAADSLKTNYKTPFENSIESSSNKIRKIDGLISSLESRLSLRPPKESPMLTESQSRYDVMEGKTEEFASFSVPTQPAKLVSLQRARPKIQHKRRLPSRIAQRDKESCLKTLEETNNKIVYNSTQKTSDSSSNGLIQNAGKTISSSIFSDSFSPTKSILRSNNSIDVSDKITVSNSAILKSNEIITDNFRHINKMGLSPGANIFTTEGKPNTRSISKNFDKSDLENTPFNKLSSVTQQEVDISSSKITNLFASDSSDEDCLFSFRNNPQKINESVNLDNSETGINANGNSTANKRLLLDNNAKLISPSEKLQESLIEREKQNILSETINKGRKNSSKSSYNLSKEEHASQPISRSVDLSPFVQQKQSGLSNLFDSSSDEDGIFSSKCVIQSKKTLLDDNQISHSTRNKYEIVNKNYVSDRTVVDAAKCIITPPLKNDPLVIKGIRETDDRNVNSNLSKTVAPKSKIIGHGSYSKNLYAGRLCTKNEAESFKLFTDDSSDEEDLFSSKSIKHQNREVNPDKIKPESCGNANIIDKDIKRNPIRNPLLFNDNELPVPLNRNIKEETNQNILNVTSVRKEFSATESTVERADGVEKTMKVRSRPISPVLTKPEQITKNIDIFGSDQSDEDGIFSSKSIIPTQRRTTLKGNTQGRDKLGVVSPNNKSILKTELPGYTDSDAIEKNTRLYTENLSNKIEVKTTKKKVINTPENSQYVKSSRLKNIDGDSLSVNDSSNDSDDIFSFSTKSVSSISNKTKTISIKSVGTTEGVKSSYNVQPDHNSRKVISNSDDDQLFNQKKQPVNTKILPAQTKLKNIFPSSDEDDDLFKSAKGSGTKNTTIQKSFMNGR